MFTVEEKPHYLSVRFHVVDSANALSLSGARELSGVVRSYRGWKLPVVVASGHPSVFCSGGNLSDYARLRGRAPGLKVNREITRVLDAFGRWPVVKIACVSGDVLGGGMEWLARFDFRLCAPHVLLAFWQRRIGLSSGWGGGRAWAAKIGEDRVRQLLIEGRLLGASEAMTLGLVDRVVPAWRLAEAVAELAREVGGGSASSVGVSGGTPLVGWSAAKENSVFSKLWMGPAHKRVLERWKK